MDNQFDSATPEQKLHTLIAELRTPVQIIRSLAEIIRLRNQANSIGPQEILSVINTISEATDKMENLLDETVRSKGFYMPSKDLSSIDILLGLRQQLLEAREKNDTNTLQSLALVFNIIGEIADQKGIEGMIFGILENLGNSAMDSVEGVPWKSIIPSEEEIISALNRS
jgi:signal transduction histidine kinase